MKIGTKLKIGFGIVTLLAIGISGAGIYQLKSVDGMIQNQLEQALSKMKNAEVLDKYSAVTGYTSIAAVKVTDEYDIKRFTEIFNENEIESDKVESALRLLMEKSSQQEKDQFEKLSKERAVFKAKVEKAFKDRGVIPQEEINKYVREVVMPGWEIYKGELTSFVKFYQDYIEQTQSEVSEAASSGVNVVVTFLILAIILSTFLSLRITFEIVRSLTQAQKYSRRLGEGKFKMYIENEVYPNDEFGDVLRSIALIEKNVKDALVEIINNSNSINHISSELTNRNLNLSTRTEQQAASVEETAATMEELSSAINQNAQNAVDAANLSKRISANAEKGVVMVKDVVHKMHEIKDSSDKISQITSLIDSIAFQTNILALNAAVEAARAGEHGRGFAVVASEVRSLSQKSAQAAKDIKHLIDVSSQNVQAGNLVAVAVERQIEQIVSEFSSVTDLISQISFSSQEQSNGVSQIHEAISQIETVTQQNASLVEESAVAAEDLATQGKNLQTSVSKFEIV